jgi:hypothetical protein
MQFHFGHDGNGDRVMETWRLPLDVDTWNTVSHPREMQVHRIAGQ